MEARFHRAMARIAEQGQVLNCNIFPAFGGVIKGDYPVAFYYSPEESLLIVISHDSKIN